MQLMAGSGNSRIRNGRSVAWCCAQTNQRMEGQYLLPVGVNNSALGPELQAVNKVALDISVSSRLMDVQPPQYFVGTSSRVQTRSTLLGKV